MQRPESEYLPTLSTSEYTSPISLSKWYIEETINYGKEGRLQHEGVR